MNQEETYIIPNSTEEVEIPNQLIDQIIGQETAVETVRLAAKQRRFLFLVGEPGTGKSLLGQAVSEILAEDALEDIISIDNIHEKLLPEIQTKAAGEGKNLITQAKDLRRQSLLSERFILWIAASAIIIVSLFQALKNNGSYDALIFGGILLFLLYLVHQNILNKTGSSIPKILVNNANRKSAPFIDATGSQSGALLGDVRHDPYQSGGSETPPHHLLEAGAIHRAHKGVLFIDEVSTLSMESQQSLLTAIQEKELPIIGRSPGSSGTMVRSQSAPCDFLLILAGNVEDIDKMHPALRSRIRGYGYEIFTNSKIPVNSKNTKKMVQFIAQEIFRDGKIPHMAKDGIKAFLKEAISKSGQEDFYIAYFRELGGLIRCAGDLAKNENSEWITEEHVIKAKKFTMKLEEQQLITNK